MYISSNPTPPATSLSTSFFSGSAREGGPCPSRCCCTSTSIAGGGSRPHSPRRLGTSLFPRNTMRHLPTPLLRCVALNRLN